MTSGEMTTRGATRLRFRTLTGRGAAALVFLLLGSGARALSLNSDAGVAPKVFTPNADTVNDVVCFQIDNPELVELRGTVADARGAEVADLRPASAACAPPHDVYDLMWDGRDRAGRTAPAGPYFYRIEGEGVMFTGVVVVAK